MPDRTLGPDPERSIAAITALHREDRPDCPMKGLFLNSAGFICGLCRWQAVYPEGT